MPTEITLDGSAQINLQSFLGRAAAVPENTHVQSNLQQALDLGDKRAHVCPLCSTVLPDWPLDSGPYDHCDPRPPRRGIWGADAAEELGTETYG